MYTVGRQLNMVPEEIRNPATEIVPFPEKKRRRYVTLAEMPLLAAAIDEVPNEFAGHALWLLLLTGIRRSEILAAKWSDVDWDNGTLCIGETKNSDPVLTPLSRAAIARLNMIKSADNPHIICGDIPGEPLVYLDAMWRRIRKRTGFHDRQAVSIRAKSMSGRKPLPQPRRPDQHVRGHMKAIPNLAHHGHAELPFPGHDLANPTGRPQEFGELSPREAVLVHQIGQKLRERGRPTGPTALLVRFDQSRLGDQARLMRWISRIHQFFNQRFRLLVIPPSRPVRASRTDRRSDRFRP